MYCSFKATGSFFDVDEHYYLFNIIRLLKDVSVLCTTMTSPLYPSVQLETSLGQLYVMIYNIYFFFQHHSLENRRFVGEGIIFFRCNTEKNKQYTGSNEEISDLHLFTKIITGQ